MIKNIKFDFNYILKEIIKFEERIPEITIDLSKLHYKENIKNYLSTIYNDLKKQIEYETVDFLKINNINISNYINQYIKPNQIL